MEYRHASQLMVEVERILLDKWDPIGVKGEPMAESEYSTYAGIVTSMLFNGKSEEAVAAYLDRVEREKLNLGPHENRCKAVAHECRMLLA